MQDKPKETDRGRCDPVVIVVIPKNSEADGLGYAASTLQTMLVHRRRAQKNKAAVWQRK